MPRLLVHALALVLLWPVASCHRPPTGKGKAPSADRPGAFARVITSERDLLGGLAADGAIGDLLLENGIATFVVEAAGPGQGFAISGGSIVDAAHRDSDGDLLNQTFLYLDDNFPEQPIYTTVTIADPGGPGRTAVVRSVGTDSIHPEIELITEFHLAPEVPYLKLITTVTNKGTKAIEHFELGDAVQWGRSQHWAPGYGYDIAKKKISVSWLAGLGPGGSYGWTVARGMLSVHSGASWSDPIVKTVDLPPGKTASYTRYFLVGTGDVASLFPSIFQLRGEPSGTLHGRVVEEVTGKGIGAGMLEIRTSAGAHFATVATGADGGFSVRLPPGEWRLASGFPGRVPAVANRSVRVKAGKQTEITYEVSAQGAFVFDVRSDGVPIPARVTIVGIGATESPHFGPNYLASGAGNVVFLPHGTGRTALPPGRYRVHASRGIEYGLATIEATVHTGKDTTVALVLEKQLDPPGWISGDFHQHALNSFDSAVSLEDRVIANAAEGVEILVSTDHEFITDYAPVIERLGLGAWLVSFPGLESTTSSVGHFNCYPMTPRPELPLAGATPAEGRTPARIFAACRKDPLDKVVQVNHPRASSGYFNLVGMDPETGVIKEEARKHPNAVFTPDFDALEVFNGKHVRGTEQVLKDWYRLLNAGRRYTATGNSDTHTLTHDNVGYPRNLVRIGHDDLRKLTHQQLVTAVKREHAVVVTNGPVPMLSVGDTGVGGTVTVKKGAKVDFRVTVDAADWVSLDRLVLVRDGRAILTRKLDPKDRRVRRYEKTHSVQFDKSGWVVVEVRGSESLAPVVVGRTARDEVHALGFTNPIWVEVE